MFNLALDNSLPATPKHIASVPVEFNELEILGSSDSQSSSSHTSPQYIIADTKATIELINNNSIASINNISKTIDYVVGHGVNNDDAKELASFSIADCTDDNVLRQSEEINDNRQIFNNRSEATDNSGLNLHNLLSGKSIALDLNTLRTTTSASDLNEVTADGLSESALRPPSSPASISPSTPEELAVTPPPLDELVMSARIDSPPSLQLSPEKYSENDECDININMNVVDNDDDGPAVTLPFPDDADNEVDEEADEEVDDYNRQCELNINAYDDTTSLPSLKLDSMRATPAPTKSDDDDFSIDDSDNLADEVAVDDIQKTADLVSESKIILEDIPSWDERPQGNDTNDFAFEADFSQFSAFETAVAPDASILQTEQHIDISTSSINQIPEDDFDDFESFQAAEPPPLPPTTTAKKGSHELNDDDSGDFDDFKASEDAPSLVPELDIPVDADDDDDDFGDFNDFQQQQPVVSQTIPQSTSTNSISSLPNHASSTIDIQFNVSKIQPLLDQMFPGGSGPTLDDSDAGYESSTQTVVYTNEITTVLKDVENSKALDHQWLSSMGKSALVKALGIDSRNIVSQTIGQMC